MPQVEVPIHWLWLSRGAEISLNMSPTGHSLTILDNFEKSIAVGGRVPLKVPIVSLSINPNSHPSIEGLIADQFVRLLKHARAVLRLKDLHMYWILKSKGLRGGVNSGAEGSPVVDSAELGFVCLDQVLLNMTGLTVLSPSMIGDLLLPSYIQEAQEPEPPEEVPRVSRYERKWVI